MSPQITNNTSLKAFQFNHTFDFMHFDVKKLIVIFFHKGDGEDLYKNYSN